MIQELFQLYADRWQFFLKLTLQHLEISLIAIVAALCIGLSLGILISSYRRSSSLVLGLTNFMYTIPSIALFGFLIPFSGIGDTTAIFALTVYALLPMVRNTYTGITGIDREIIEAARKVTGHPIPAKVAPRRAGDPSTLIASNRRAVEILGWKPRHSGLDDIIGSAWNWHQSHPDGYAE